MQANVLNELIGTLGLFQTKLFQYQFHFGEKYQPLKTEILTRSGSLNNLMNEIGTLLLSRDEVPISTCCEFIEYAWIKEHPYYVSLTDDQLIEDLRMDLKTIYQALAENKQYFLDDPAVLAIFQRISNELATGLKSLE